MSVHARVEQMRTATTIREVYKRIQAEDRAYDQQARRGRGGNYSARNASGRIDVMGGVRSFASDIHGQIQSARAGRAGTERTLNDMLVQAIPNGATRAEIGRHRQTVYDFARRNGIREEEIAPALNEAQTRFSAFSSGRTEQERAGNLGNMLEAIRYGRLSGNSATDTANFFGALMSPAVGLNATQAMGLTRQAIAASFKGAVSLGDVSSQSLGSMLASVSSARAQASQHGGDPEAAGMLAVRRFFADQQIQAAVGARAGVAGVREVGLERALQGNTVGMLYHRLQENFRGNAEAQTRIGGMFSVQNGQASLRDQYHDPTEFATQMFQLFNGDSAAMANFMGARGRWSRSAGGASRVLSAPITTALSNMFSVGSNVLQQRNDIMNSDLTSGQVQEMESVRGEEQDTQLARVEQEHRDALNDNTSAIVKLSNSFADFAASNPMSSAAAKAGWGALGGAVTARVGTLAWGGGTAAGGAGVGAGGGGAAAAGMGLGSLAAGVGGAAMAGASLYMLNQQHNARTGTTAADRARGAWGIMMGDSTVANQVGGAADAAAQQNRAAMQAAAQHHGNAVPTALQGNGPTSAESFASMVAQAFRNNPPTVRLDTHDAEHLITLGNSANRQGQQ